jgi:D-lyxose ketol-isomerase
MRKETLDNLEKIEKPWGYEVIWGRSASQDGYIGKLLFIDAGERLSMQYHEDKEETITVKTGTLYLQTIGLITEDVNSRELMKTSIKEIKLIPGDVYHIPPFMTHRFAAKEENVEIIEVSTCFLDDVVRIQDDYGRLGDEDEGLWGDDDC